MVSKTLSVYILLDQSGSMHGKWSDSIGAINSYVETLKESVKKADITVASFDSYTRQTEQPNSIRSPINNAIVAMNQPYFASSTTNELSFNVLREEVSINKFKNIEVNETRPRGGTPLYDATAKLLNLASKKNSEKTVVIIVTDGEENTSQTYKLESIKDRIADFQNRGWEVIFLGAEFSVQNVTQSFGLGMNKMVSTSDSAQLNNVLRGYATATASYMSGSEFDTTSIQNDLTKC